MAKPKQDTLIKVLYHGNIHVYTFFPETVLNEIVEIEGIDFICHGTKNPIIVSTDPRYDVNEIAQEIEELLSYQQNYQMV